MTIKKTVFTKSDELKGYPFFSLSLWSAWIIYKNNPHKNYTRWSIETTTTISQILAGYKTEIEMDREKGFNDLKLMLERQQDKILKARIYPNKNFVAKTLHPFYFEINNGNLTQNLTPSKFQIDVFKTKILDQYSFQITTINGRQFIL